jgi:hypothetical protein
MQTAPRALPRLQSEEQQQSASPRICNPANPGSKLRDDLGAACMIYFADADAPKRQYRWCGERGGDSHFPHWTPSAPPSGRHLFIFSLARLAQDEKPECERNRLLTIMASRNFGLDRQI